MEDDNKSVSQNEENILGLIDDQFFLFPLRYDLVS